ncbi:MAG TPA: universal stress protein [Thermomicrobiales bacterium]|nr:universal stress protein [Thermomicrobiales bacterium]
MQSHVSGECPLHVYLAASSDTQIPLMTDFVGGITGVDARMSVVPDGELDGVVSREKREPAEMIVLERGEGTTREHISRVALNSPVPVMVLPPCGDAGYPSLSRLLVPLDGSDRAAQALPLAKHIAMGAGLPVYFVMVIDPSRVIPPAFAYDPDAWMIVSELRETAHWALRQAETSLRQAGVNVESDLLFGPVNASIQNVLRPSDLIVMTTHGSGKKRSTLGSVAERVLASAAGPVIVIRGTEPGDVVVDGYEACSWVEPLSRRATTTLASAGAVAGGD